MIFPVFLGGGGGSGGSGLDAAAVDVRIAAAGPAFAGTKATAGGVVRYLGSGTGTDQLAAILAAMNDPTTGFQAGQHCRLELLGKIRIDGTITQPTAHVASLEIVGIGCDLICGGVQDFTAIALSGYGWAQNTDFTVRDLRVTGLWDTQGADSSYRGIKLSDCRHAVVSGCKVDNVRGFSISVDRAGTALVAQNIVTRSGKDAISVTNCRHRTISGNKVRGGGDNGIASHSTYITTSAAAAGPIAIGAITTSAGSATVAVTFPASNAAVPGDVLVITGLEVVDGLDLKGTWPLVTKPTGSTATFTVSADAATIAAVVGGAHNTGTLAFELGYGWEERQQSTVIEGNTLADCLGLKVLGGPNTKISGNDVKLVHGIGIYCGGEGAGGEGQIAFRSLSITDNHVSDVIRSNYLGVSAPDDACIFVQQRWGTIEQLQIEGNILNCNRPLRSGETKPSDWARGLDQPYSGPASPQNGWFSAAGYVDVPFGTSTDTGKGPEPTYALIKGIVIDCRNAHDRVNLRVAGNMFKGLAAHISLRRIVPLNGGGRVKPTIANASIANWETALAAAGYSLLNVDLAPVYGLGIRGRKGKTSGTQPTVDIELRLRRNDGIGVDAYVETSWASGTAFATSRITMNADNTDFSGASITALPADAKRSMDIVPYGYTSINGNAFELVTLEAIIDHDGNDSDFVVPAAQRMYDPEGVYSGAYLSPGTISAATWATMSSAEKAGRDWDVV